MNSFQFQLYSNEIYLNINVEDMEVENDEADDAFISSIIYHRLNHPLQVINIHPKSDHWYSNILFNYDDTSIADIPILPQL